MKKLFDWWSCGSPAIKANMVAVPMIILMLIIAPWMGCLMGIILAIDTVIRYHWVSNKCSGKADEPEDCKDGDCEVK